MPSPFSSLLLATSLVALPGSTATASTAVSSFTQAPVPAGASAPKRATAAPSKAKPTPTSRGKRTSKATPAASKAGKAPAKSKDARKADCDTPEAKVAVVKPPPVPVDPFAPVVAPCAEPKP